MTSCAVSDCAASHYARGLCHRHYQRQRRGGDAFGPRRNNNGLPRGEVRTCSVDDCERRHQARGYCNLHYMRFKKYGDPMARRWARGDGHITRDGYRKVFVDGKLRLEHRLVMAERIGRPLLRNENVHHVNGDRLDNRPENLELWLVTQPSGQRVDDLIRFVVENYRGEALVSLTS